MNKYNDKIEEQRANKVLIAMVVVFCIIMVMDYVTM